MYSLCDKSFNGQQYECADNGLKSGYTGRAIIALAPFCTYTASDGGMQAALTTENGMTTDCLAVDNLFASQPLNGSQLSLGDADSRRKFSRTWQFRLMRGQNGKGGLNVDALSAYPLLIIAERNDGTYAVGGVRGTAKVSAVTQDEYASDGDYVVTVTSAEDMAEFNLIPTTGQSPVTPKSAFEAWWDDLTQ